MKTISIPTNNRPEKLKQVLESIRQAKGIDGWTLVFSCEPNREVERIVSTVNWAPTYFNRNPVPMGCWTNTFIASAFAMAIGSVFNLYLEDDFLISRDALVLCDQFVKSKKQGFLCLRRWHDTQDMARPADVSPAFQGLFGDGFAWHAKDWQLLRSFWFQKTHEGFSMWDWSVEYWCLVNSIPCWRPLVNRSTSNGQNGTHHRNGADMNHFGPCYDGCIETFNFI